MKRSSLSKVLASLVLCSAFTFAATVNAVEIPQGVKLAPVQEIFENDSVPETLDPNLAQDVTSTTYIQKVFDTLTRLGPDNTYIPVAATSWKVSEDGLRWTFNLRKDAKWQDGKAVTAQDFVYSWRRLTDPKTASAYGFYLGIANVVNAQKINEENADVNSLGVKALDDYTLEVSLTVPTPWLDSIVSNAVLAPVRQDLVEKYGQEWTKVGNYIGNGPYKFVDYKFNDTIVLEKDNNYWDAKNIYINKITYDFINSTNNRYFGYITGKYLAALIPASYKKKVMETRPEEVHNAVRNSVYWLVFNTETVKDPKVRQAVSLLIDRKTLTEKINNYGQATSIFVPNNMPDGEMLKEQAFLDNDYKANVAQANKLLVEAGYSKDKPRTITYLATNSPTNKKFLNALVNWLEKGSQGKIKVETKILEEKAYLEARRARQADLAFGGWAPDYNQVSTYFNIFLCNSGVNEFGYCNPEYDKLVNTANINPNPEQRQELYKQALDIFNKDAAVLPTYRASYSLLVSPALGGFKVNNETRYVRDYYIIDGKKAKEDK